MEEMRIVEVKTIDGSVYHHPTNGWSTAGGVLTITYLNPYRTYTVYPEGQWVYASDTGRDEEDNETEAIT